MRKEVAGKEDFALELFVELALCTGARLEGILNIKKKDLALSTKSVTISDFKTKSTYTGFLSKKALEMINQGVAEVDELTKQNVRVANDTSVVTAEVDSMAKVILEDVKKKKF